MFLEHAFVAGRKVCFQSDPGQVERMKEPVERSSHWAGCDSFGTRKKAVALCRAIWDMLGERRGKGKRHVQDFNDVYSMLMKPNYVYTALKFWSASKFHHYKSNSWNIHCPPGRRCRIVSALLKQWKTVEDFTMAKKNIGLRSPIISVNKCQLMTNPPGPLLFWTPVLGKNIPPRVQSTAPQGKVAHEGGSVLQD